MSDEITVVRMHVNYYSGQVVTRGYDEAWATIPVHCPNCGQKSVWHETSGADYYVEERYLCTACGHSFYLPGGVRDDTNDEQGKQRLEVLRRITQ